MSCTTMSHTQQYRAPDRAPARRPWALRRALHRGLALTLGVALLALVAAAALAWRTPVPEARIVELPRVLVRAERCPLPTAEGANCPVPVAALESE